MEEAYKVGVTFALKNLVTAELLKIAKQFAAANKEAQALQATLKAMGGISGAGVVSGISAAASGMGDSFKYAATQVDGVRAKLDQLRPAAQNKGFWGPNSSMAKWGLAYGALDAGKTAIGGAMSLDDTIARGMIAMGLPVGANYMSSDVAKRMRGAISGTATDWGVGFEGTQDAALQLIRGLDPLSSEQRMRLLPALLNFSGAEVLGKHGTTMPEAVEAAISLAHQLKDYSPEQIEPILGAFAKMSMGSPASLKQLTRASSYYLPLLTSGLGMDPTQLLAIGEAGSQMGLNTKAGTWLAQLFQAPFVADLTSKRQSARRNALEELGLVKNGKPVTKDAIEFLTILSDHLQAMPAEQRMRNVVAAFGQQGGRGAAIYSDPAALKNIAALAAGIGGGKTPEQLKAAYGNSPKVQFDKAVENFGLVLRDLGDAVLPEVTSGLKVFTLGMKALVAVISLPDWLAEKAATGVKSGVSWFTGSSAAPRAGQQQTIVIDHATHLDGNMLAKSVTEYQIDGMAKAPSTSNSVDLRLSPSYAGFGYQ
jgi:hypothetical protein